MKADLQFDFLVDRGAHTLTIKREFAAKRPLVWDCYTRRELLEQWFAPRPLTTKTKSMEFKEGGHWHYAMVDPGGKEYWGRTDYQTITPMERYTALDAFSDESGAPNPDLPRAHWEVTFSDVGARTLVHTLVTYPSREDLEKVIQMGMEAGLASTLEHLDEVLATLSSSS